MADFTYNIFAAASNTSPNFTSINGARAHFVANNVMGAGTATVPAASTLYFEVSGFLSSGGDFISGITLADNTTSQIVVKGAGGEFNAADAALRPTSTAYDGVDYGGSAQLDINQPNCTVQDLVFKSTLGTYDVVKLYSTSTTERARIKNCLINAASTSHSYGLGLRRADAYNCVVLLSHAAGTGSPRGIQTTSDTVTCAIEQCTVVSLYSTPAGPAFYNNGDPPPTAKNCYAGGFSSLLSSGTWPVACTGNATDLASGWVSGTLYSTALSTTQFTSITSGSEDLRTQSGSVLKTTGATKLSAPADVDIFNATRSATATIGAYEVGGGGGTLTADQGSFALTGQTAGLLFNRALTADYGAYALNGQDATLTYVPAQAFSMSADVGSFALTGQTVTLQKDTPGQFTLQVDAGSYAWTGNAALIDSSMNGGQGSYALNGQDATFTRGYPQAYSMAANQGSYTFNGQNARLDWSGAPVVPNRQAGIYMGMRIGL